MHEDVEAIVVELCLHAVRDAEGPRVNVAIRVHVRHEDPAATLDNVISDRESIVLDCMVPVSTVIGASSYVVVLHTSGLKGSNL